MSKENIINEIEMISFHSYRRLRFTILTKYGADCQTWVEDITSQYPDEKDKKESVFIINPNVEYPIMLNQVQVKELIERLTLFLKDDE